MKKKWFRFALALLCLALLLGIIDSVILTNISAAKMGSLFVKYASVTGHDEITTDMYPEIAGQLVRYLFSGRDEHLPSSNGRLLFTEAENLHLKDCSGILRAMRAFRLVFFGLAALPAGIGLYLYLKKRHGVYKAAVPMLCDAFSASSLFLLAAASILLVWGILDFDGLFIAFHRVFFTNDLWILDPRTDLLIQLMPEAFFAEYARDILLSLAPVLLLMAVFPLLNRRIKASVCSPAHPL